MVPSIFDQRWAEKRSECVLCITWAIISRKVVRTAHVIQRFPRTSISLCTSHQVYIVLANYPIEGSDTFIANSTARICYWGRGGVCVAGLSSHPYKLPLPILPATPPIA